MQSEDGKVSGTGEVGNLFCPLENLELRGTWCPVSTCVYNYSGKCKHGEMTTTPPAEYLQKRGLLEEAQKQAERIKSLIYLDSYIQYVTSKTVLNGLSKNDFDKLLDEETYSQWPAAVADKYPAVRRMLLSRSDNHDS